MKSTAEQMQRDLKEINLGYKQPFKTTNDLSVFRLECLNFTPEKLQSKPNLLSIDHQLLISINEKKQTLDVLVDSPHHSNFKEKSDLQNLADVTEITTKKSRSEAKLNLQSTLQNKYDSGQTLVAEFPHLKLDLSREQQFISQLTSLENQVMKLQASKEKQKRENLRLEEDILKAREAIKSNREIMTLMREELGHVHNQNKFLLDQKISLEGKIKNLSSKRIRKESNHV